MARNESTIRAEQPHLARELLRLERRVAGAAVLVSLGGLVVAAAFGLLVHRVQGLALVACGAVLVGWFSTLRWALVRNPGAVGFTRVAPFIEGMVPTAFLVLDFTIRGAVYALDVPTAPQLYGAIVLLQVIRLRRWLPLGVAAWGAAQYLLVYALLVRPALPFLPSPDDPHGLQLVAIRAALLLLTGGLGVLVTRGLRHAVGSAEKSRRAEELFGKYRLGARIALGGMGEVFRATYSPEGGFSRPVALKRITPQLAQDEKVVQAFRTEAELCSRLLHPNIVQVLDFGRVEDTYFLSMEFVDGGTLGQLGDRARALGLPVPERVVVQLGRDILAGLSFAHDVARGEDGRLLRVLHRDLNPPNVLLTRTGEAKLSDFGIARAVGERTELVTGTVIGKSSYMSPEQACAEPQDGRSDLFAVGIILWELLAGRRLYARGPDTANMLAIVNEDAPAPGKYRRLDARWDAFFARALARSLAERFQSAEEMAEALAACVPGERTGPAEVVAFNAALDAAGAAQPPARAAAGADEATKPLPPPRR